MEMLNYILNYDGMGFILPLLGALLGYCLGYYWLGLRREKKNFTKLQAWQDQGIKQQERASQQLNVVINELKRANRYLAELAEMDVMDVVEESQPSANGFEDSAVSSENQHKLYVGNIDYTATETELAAYFAGQGTILSVNIPINRYNGKARGFGFVTFGSREEAERAMCLHGTEFKGRQIQVNFAKERDFA